MKDDRVVCRDGRYIRLTEQQLESLLESAFKTAMTTALRQLDAKDSDEVADVSCSGAFGEDFITTHVRLRDGREASASASIWPDGNHAN